MPSTSGSIIHRIYERIEQGKCSPTRYASIDMFVGPYVGRNVSSMRLLSLVADIRGPQRFQSSQPLLVVRSRHGHTKGKLIIIAGGHRFCSSSRTLHTLILPYKLVSFSGLGANGEDLDVLKYKGFIAFQVEVNEPRPERYGFMQQVLLYEDLKEHWKHVESMRVSRLSGRKAVPQAMTHPKVFDMYEKLTAFHGSKCRWAIEFLSRKDNRNVEIVQSTRRQYMSGADRLLDAGVVPYLSYLEETGVASFTRSSLYAVRNWSPEKVKKVVELWKVRRDTGVPVKYLFNDRIGREVDGKGRGRKSTQHSTNSQYTDIPVPEDAPKSKGHDGDGGTVKRLDKKSLPSPGGVGTQDREIKQDVIDTSSVTPRQPPDPTSVEVEQENTVCGEEVLEHVHLLQGLPKTQGVSLSGLGGNVNDVDELGPGQVTNSAENIHPFSLSNTLLKEGNTNTHDGQERASASKSAINDAAGDTKRAVCEEHANTKPIFSPLGLCRLAEKGGTRAPATAKGVDFLLRDLVKRKEREGSAACDVELEHDINVVKKMKQKVDAGTGSKTLPLHQLAAEVPEVVNENERKEIALVASGGFLEGTMTLREGDVRPIRDFHLATDLSIMFTLSFLTRWNSDCISKFTLLDSIRTCGWWESDVSLDKVLLRKLTNVVRRDKDLCKRIGEDIWRSEVCFMPICGDGHWSLVVLVNMECVLRESLRKAPPKGGRGARIFFIDSIGDASPHRGITGNVFYYLRACYPACFRPSAKAIEDRVSCQFFTFQRQTGLECGFCVGYHAALIARLGVLSLKTEGFRKIMEKLEHGRSLYSFAQYQNDVQGRLGYILTRYEEGSLQEVQLPVWTWDGKDDEAPEIKVSRNVEGTALRETLQNGQNGCERNSKQGREVDPADGADLGANEGVGVGQFIGDYGGAGTSVTVVALPSNPRKRGGCVLPEDRRKKIAVGVGALRRTKSGDTSALARNASTTCAGEGVAWEEGARKSEIYKISGCSVNFTEEWIRDLVSGVITKATSARFDPVRGTGEKGDDETDNMADVVGHSAEDTTKDSQGFSDGFMNVVQEAMVLAKNVKSEALIREWEAYRKQIYELVSKMRTEGGTLSE